jgi:cyclic pyranopterin monophosphate synthase
MSAAEQFTHLDERGKVRMVDISGKQVSRRMARAEARVWLPAGVLALFANGDLHGPKGPVFQSAIIAGIMAAKKTGELIPLCHPLGLDEVNIDIVLEGEEVVITSVATITAKTGVEMEALTAASVAALTVYDMCKALSHDIVIREIKLMEKTGGKHDFRRKA